MPPVRGGDPEGQEPPGGRGGLGHRGQGRQSKDGAAFSSRTPSSGCAPKAVASSASGLELRSHHMVFELSTLTPLTTSRQVSRPVRRQGAADPAVCSHVLTKGLGTPVTLTGEPGCYNSERSARSVLRSALRLTLGSGISGRDASPIHKHLETQVCPACAGAGHRVTTPTPAPWNSQSHQGGKADKVDCQ